MGFEKDGRVDEELWDFLFDVSNKTLIEKVSIVSNYDLDKFRKETGSRMGYSLEGGMIEKYFLGDEIKYIKLILLGETFQSHHYFYYISPGLYFIIEEHWRFPVSFPPARANTATFQ